MRWFLRILGGVAVGVLVSILMDDLIVRTPVDPWELAKHKININVHGDASPEVWAKFRREAEERYVKDYLTKQAQQVDHQPYPLWLVHTFGGLLFGTLAAFSLLIDWRQTGFMRRRRQELGYQP